MLHRVSRPGLVFWQPLELQELNALSQLQLNDVLLA